MGNSAQDGVNMAVANKDEGINYGQYLQVRVKKKNCQIEGRSAQLSLNVNKLSRLFSPFVTFRNFGTFLLNSCIKLVGTTGMYHNCILPL